MSEGAALDQDLAAALGVAPDELPEGKDWERERAFFLRDLFTEKALKEKELVTRATDTHKMLRRRQILPFCLRFCSAGRIHRRRLDGPDGVDEHSRHQEPRLERRGRCRMDRGFVESGHRVTVGQYRPRVEFKGEVPGAGNVLFEPDVAGAHAAPE